MFISDDEFLIFALQLTKDGVHENDESPERN